MPPGSPAAIARLGDLVSKATAPYEPRWLPTLATSAPAFATTTPASTLGSDTDAGAAAQPELVPSAILLSPGGKSMVIVGGVPRAVGDEVSGHLVVAIDERCVRYRRGTKDITVDLPTPGLRGNR
jgi:hypothetical protein